jgi:hypothetical protein
VVKAAEDTQRARLPGFFGLRAEMSAVRDQKNELRYLRLLPLQASALIARLDHRISQIRGHAERASKIDGHPAAHPLLKRSG